MLNDIKLPCGTSPHLGQRVKVATINGYVDATIIGSRDSRFIKIKYDDGSVRLCHPTYGIIYVD